MRGVGTNNSKSQIGSLQWRHDRNQSQPTRNHASEHIVTAEKRKGRLAAHFARQFDTTDTMQLHRTLLLTAALLGSVVPCLYAQSSITGVWRIRVDMHDGTFQDRFLDLTQTGDSVTGSVVRNYHHEKIVRGTFQNGKLHLEVNPWREVIDSYDGQLKGDELSLTITTHRSANNPQGASANATATRSTAEAMNPPAPLPVPELHEVPDNGLVRTPPMGWNSWNHFAGKVDDKVVRAAADALVSSGMKDAGYHLRQH